MSLLWTAAINVILNYGETGEAAHLNLPELCGQSILMSQSHMEVATVCETEHELVINILLESALSCWRWLDLSFPDADVLSEAQDNLPPHQMFLYWVTHAVLHLFPFPFWLLLCLQEGHGTIPTQLFFFKSWITALNEYFILNWWPTSCPSAPIKLFMKTRLRCKMTHSNIWGWLALF